MMIDRNYVKVIGFFLILSLCVLGLPQSSLAVPSSAGQAGSVDTMADEDLGRGYGAGLCTSCGTRSFRSPCSNCVSRGDINPGPGGGGATPVPEPGTLYLLSTGLGLLSISAIRRYRQK